MKNHKNIYCFLAGKVKTLGVVFLSIFLLYSALGQGALTPPGAPAAMMKSLDQIEPRTPVNTNTTPGNPFAQFVISQPGSYYLTGNLTSAGVNNQQLIEIVTNNVTLDLNGFSLLGIQAVVSGYPSVFDSAIFITNNCNNVIVRNGIVSGWGNNGITTSGANSTFEHLTVSDNFFGGIVCYGNSAIKDCLVVSNAWYGVTVNGNGGSLVIDNVIAANDTANQAGVGALSVVSSNNRIEGNHITGNSGHGLWINADSGVNNIVIRNSVIGFGGNNYVIASGNDVGPIGTAAASTSPWANFSH
jgi:hypothetical protein